MEKEEFSFNPNRNIWDCGSTLYDSYELNSFKSQLNSAIANSSRSLSMPHFPDYPHHHHHHHHHHLSSLQQQQQQQQQQKQQPKPPLPPRPSSNKSFKISRSFQKLFGLVFKSKKGRISSNISSSNNSYFHKVEDKHCSNKEGFYVVYDDKSDQHVLSTIPELPEFEIGGLSPEISSLVRKSISERFTPISTCISCAY